MMKNQSLKPHNREDTKHSDSVWIIRNRIQESGGQRCHPTALLLIERKRRLENSEKATFLHKG
jgi:hypothetical protein